MPKIMTAIAAIGAALLGLAAPGLGDARAEAPGVKLYKLDCGTGEILRGDLFSDTGDYGPEPIDVILVTPCFLIQHPDGNLIWDTGIPDSLKDDPEAGVSPFFRFKVEKTMVGALAELDLTLGDIDYLALSHLHFDHAGNANALKGSKLIIQNAEYEAGFAEKPPFGFDPALYSELKDAERVPVHGDYDVFGDGSVVVLTTPCHTPGHQCLLVNLKEAGPVIITGDLYHMVPNRQKRIVPAFNVDRADTLASMGRIERLAENLGARIIIQHDPRDHEGIPLSPQFLQ